MSSIPSPPVPPSLEEAYVPPCPPPVPIWAAMSAEPGWFPDPNVPGQLRRWDGTQWTPEVQPAEPPAPTLPVQGRKRAVLPLVIGGVVGALGLAAAAVILAFVLGNDPEPRFAPDVVAQLERITPEGAEQMIPESEAFSMFGGFGGEAASVQEQNEALYPEISPSACLPLVTLEPVLASDVRLGGQVTSLGDFVSEVAPGVSASAYARVFPDADAAKVHLSEMTSILQTCRDGYSVSPWTSEVVAPSPGGTEAVPATAWTDSGSGATTGYYTQGIDLRRGNLVVRVMCTVPESEAGISTLCPSYIQSIHDRMAGLHE